MADKPQAPPRELRLPHQRAATFVYAAADGILWRVEGNQVVLTFYINDTAVTSEMMELLEQTDRGATYKPKSIDEQHQRLQLVAVRVPVSEFLTCADMLKERIQAEGQAKRSMQ
jgi:hypothetical protein